MLDGPDDRQPQRPTRIRPPAWRLPVRLRHLHYFVAVAELGSIRKASRALGIAQSSISRRIRDMEDELGASLFHRGQNGVALTDAGRRFLPRARAALRQIAAGVHEVAAAGIVFAGQIRIGIFSSLASGFLSDLLKAYHEHYPDVAIQLQDANPAEHIEAVRRLRIDLAFIAGSEGWEGCESEVLWYERVFAVLPSGHILARHDVLDWSYLQTEQFLVSESAPGPEIHDYLVRRLAIPGRSPDIAVHRVGRDNLLALVATGHGVTITSEATTGAYLPGIIYRPIARDMLPFSAVWSVRNDNPAFRCLLSMARGMAARH